MENVSVVIVSTDDGEWEGIYVNGLLFEEGQSLCNNHFISLINQFHHFEKAEQKWITSKDVEHLGYSFPAQLSEIPNGFLK